MEALNMLWPQIAAAVVVAICSAIVTGLVKQAARRLENVATKEFVQQKLEEHTRTLSDMFVRNSHQSMVNADLEARLRRIETAIYATAIHSRPVETP